ncbi:hypothetical protein BVX93_02250, partial [bacterium B13(2017)]
GNAIQFEDCREEYYFDNFIYPVFDDNKEKVIMVAVYASDISQRKKIEKSLKQSEERFRLVLDTSHDLITIIDKNLNTIWANKTWLDVFKDLKNSKNSMEKVHPDDKQKISAAWQNMINGKENITNIQYRYKIDKEKYNHFETTVRKIIQKDKEMFCVIAHDITERIKAEEERQTIQKLESIGLLAGGIAHDFNNLINGILGNISLTQMVIDDKDAALEKLRASEKILNQASHLTHQLLTFSKGGTPIKELINIQELILEVSEFALAGSNIYLECDLDESKFNLNADKGQIRQVIQNLIINAKHAMPQGGAIKMSCKDVYLEKETICRCNFRIGAGIYLKIIIKDEGIGIAKEHLTKIFDPYFTTKSDGHGLGLSVVFSIISKHHGCINVTSVLGEGTVFEIYLPGLEDKLDKEESKSDHISSGKGRVLFMDDEEFMRLLFQEGLGMFGFDVFTAANGEEAIDLYKKDKIDIVVLDLTIKGGKGGKETIQELKKINPNIKAIAISGYTNDPVISNPKEYGFIASVSKPCSPRNLTTIINQIL